MTKGTSREIETLTIRISIRLQRRGGRKLVMTPDGLAVRCRSRVAMRRCADAGAPMAAQDQEWGARSITDLAEQEGVTD